MDENSKIPLTQGAYNRIKQMIIDLHLRPGEILMVQQLANSLDISRTPVREALVRLSHEGFVEEADGRKFKVSEVSLATIKDLYELREALETLSLKKAIPLMAEKDFKQLDTIIDQMRTAFNENDNSVFFNRDSDFHAYIAAKYNNSLLKSVMSQINDHQQRIRYLTMYIELRLEKTLTEHEHILDALKERDEVKAIEAMKVHLHNVYDDFIKVIGKSNMNFFGVMK